MVVGRDMDLVLERLAVLQSQLAAVDPAHQLDAADRVASIACALRHVLVAVDAATQRPLPGVMRRAL